MNDPKALNETALRAFCASTFREELDVLPRKCVIPAYAGIQQPFWIPAVAGMAQVL